MKKFILIATLILSPISFAAAEGFVAKPETYSAPEAENSEVHPMYGFICYANNPRGQYFSAWGPNPYIGQQNAMNLCFRYSQLCRPDGCEYY